MAFFFTHVLPVGGFFVVFLLLGVLFVYILHFGQIGMRLPHAQTPTRQVTPTMITLSPTVAPSPTPTPAQTELDGVITIENLDASATFVGIVSVRSGRYTCRNAPLPNSSWNIVLTGGATTQVPCVIPVSSPTSLPIHTFTTVETGQNGQGRVLIDNLTPFTGTTSRDTL